MNLTKRKNERERERKRETERKKMRSKKGREKERERKCEVDNYIISNYLRGRISLVTSKIRALLIRFSA